MIIISFSHPLTGEHIAAIERSTGEHPDTLINVPVQLGKLADHSLEEQIAALVDSRIDLSPVDWQTKSLVINLPGYALAAAAVLAELHGRMGYFPRVICMERGTSGFEVVGVADLQHIREEARKRR